jgi:hypothetical protein
VSERDSLRSLRNCSRNILRKEEIGPQYLLGFIPKNAQEGEMELTVKTLWKAEKLRRLIQAAAAVGRD